MIKISISKNKITISGHANYADYGKDIVCASVSSISITTINAILRFDPNSISYKQDEGYLEITILKSTKEVEILISNMIDLLKELEKKYNNIKIN